MKIKDKISLLAILISIVSLVGTVAFAAGKEKTKIDSQSTIIATTERYLEQQIGNIKQLFDERTSNISKDIKEIKQINQKLDDIITDLQTRVVRVETILYSINKEIKDK